MSYSWVFFADFVIPHKHTATLKKKLPPRRTRDEELRSDCAFFDRSYAGDTLGWRGIFDKSQYAEMLKDLDVLCEQVRGHGGVGEAVVVGNTDGPMDRGERLTVAPAKVLRKALTSAEAKKAVSSAAYQEVQARLRTAFAPKQALKAQATGAEQAASRLPPSVRAPVLRLLDAVRAVPDPRLRKAIDQVGPLMLVEKHVLLDDEWTTPAELRAGLTKWFRKSSDQPFAHLLRLLGAIDPAQATEIGAEILRDKPPAEICRAAIELVVKSAHAALVLDHMGVCRLPAVLDGGEDLEWIEHLAAAKSITTAELARRCLSSGYDAKTGRLPVPALFLACAVLMRDDDRALSAKLDNIRAANPKRFSRLTDVMECLGVPGRDSPRVARSRLS
jgi:hypothetical protein